MSFNEWKCVKVKDIAEIIFSGGTPSTKKEEFWNGKINWLSSGETRNKFIYNTEKKITQEGVDNSSTKLAKKKDIVIASAGQGFTRGQTSMCLIDTYINQSLICIRAKKDVIDPYYLFYNISSRYAELRQISDGHSIRGSLTTKIISDLNISLPTIKEQKSIAKVISDLDEKIETNNKINKTLEEMAQAIFKQWFVDFEFPNEEGKPYKSSGGEMVESELGMIPKRWKISELGDICDISSSKRIFMKEYVDEGVPFFRSKEIIEKSRGNSITTELFISRDKYDEIKIKFGVPLKNDILLTSVGTLGIPYLVEDEEFYFKDGNLTWLKDFKQYFNFYVYYFLTSRIGKKSIDEITIGSTQKALTISSLKKIKIIKPINETMKQYNKVIESIIKQTKVNIKENEKLISIRDTLLPKLMSGEIRVPLSSIKN
ncbi:restriction endonuclease subunit S [Clostridium paraputrificum]|uniref:Type I restriction modification DNA specificity domain-containing protein n=1 Tax=Clostridium paraputrificum TaxID=29363 RepID=A0A1B8RT15_9CLOT|nr:restriction endonuclease subunit S [Clostridium paraputrificum]OBY11864.1 hypothetical protein CP373A1_02765 [Clostridium paraputrificum]